MARDIKNPGVFAEDAETSVPANPLPGITYRDDATGLANIDDGWPFDRIVNSPEFNKILHDVTKLTDLIDRTGILEWKDDVEYDIVPAYVQGSDGDLYRSLVANGPGSSVVDPTTDNGTTWENLRDALAPIEEVVFAFATCADANPLEFVSDYQPDDMNKQPIITDVDLESGVLIEANPGAYLDLVLPYMVIIGDSISEGHPALHGRLHPNGAPGYDPNYQSEPGQLSYEFSRRFGIPLVNQGVGSETSTNVRTRWPRDVLAQTFDPGDGRGNNTMDFSGQIPHAVWLHVGVNDVFGAAPLATIQGNFNFFAQSCEDNDILLIVDNVGSASNYDAPKIALATQVNDWLNGAFKTAFPEVQIIDYLDWSSNGTGNYNILKPGFFADTVHPNKAGYADFADYAAARTNKAVFLNSLVLNSTIDGATRFSRITGFKFNGSTYRISGDKAAIQVTALADLDDPVTRLEPTEYTIVTGPGTNQYAGFAQVFAEFKNSQTEQIFPPISGGSGGVVAAGVVIGAALSNDWHNFGIANIDTTDIANGNVLIQLDNTASHLVVTMAGVSNDSYNFHPRWSSGIIPNGQTDWDLNLTRISDGVAASNPIFHQYQIIAYNFLGN